jgi:hypothetical protein
MRRFLIATVVALAAATSTVAIASPAQALTICNSTVSKVSTYYDPAGDFNLSIKIPSYGTSIECYMNVGATGPAVGVVQTALNYCYNAELTVDNSFGPKTRDALAAAQRAERVGDDGGYGPVTRGVLKFKTSTDAHGYAHCGRLK